MEKTTKGRESGGDALSHMYIGPQQRAAMKADLYDRARKAGKSHNQAMGMAEHGVAEFMRQIEAQRREALDKAPRQALAKAFKDGGGNGK